MVTTNVDNGKGDKREEEREVRKGTERDGRRAGKI